MSWTESGALPHKLVLTFQGVNLEALERMEVENFKRGLSAPEADDPGGTAMARGTSRGLTPRQGIGMGLGFVFAIGAYELAHDQELGDGLSFLVVLFAFVLGNVLLPIAYAALRRRASVQGVVPTEPFQIEATPAGLTVKGATIPVTTLALADIVELLCAPRLGFRGRDGRFVAFPCALAEKVANVALAARLQEIVGELRTTVGYRGA